MIFIRDDQVAKLFVSDFTCKIAKDYDFVVSVSCPFPIFPQAFRQTLVDMVLFIQITVSLHKQRASCMNKSICCFFFTTCCSSAQVHVSRMTHVLLFSACLMLSWVKQSPLWPPDGPTYQWGGERRRAYAPWTAATRATSWAATEDVQHRSTRWGAFSHIEPYLLSSQKCWGNIFA